MNIFDFLFPEEAQASHLRGILKHQQLEASRNRQTRAGGTLEDAFRRIDELENQVGKLVSANEESTIVTRALVELIIESSDYTSEDLKNLIEDIDTRDGVIDGKITSENEKPKKKFIAKRAWQDQSK